MRPLLEECEQSLLSQCTVATATVSIDFCLHVCVYSLFSLCLDERGFSRVGRSTFDAMSSSTTL